MGFAVHDCSRSQRFGYAILSALLKARPHPRGPSMRSGADWCAALRARRLAIREVGTGPAGLGSGDRRLG